VPDYGVDTKYGFIWGVAAVERLASYRGSVIIRIKTPREELVVRVTPTGLLRVERDKP
jgi:hypothetical protein